MERVLGEWAGFDVPCIVRTPAQLRALVAEADAVPALLPGDSRRYLAVVDGVVAPDAARTLEAWERKGEAARVLTGAVLAELTVAFHEATLTNARIERITGLTTTSRSLDVVRAVDDRWGHR